MPLNVTFLKDIIDISYIIKKIKSWFNLTEKIEVKCNILGTGNLWV